MAESGEEGMAASWWGGWLQTAKDKSMQALDMVRKDLTEFGYTMQNDAGHAVEVTSSTLKESLKAEKTSKLTKGLNTFLEHLSQALVVPPDDEGQIPITASSAELYDRAKARVHAIQLDPGTYLEEPSGPEETYCMWCEGFDLEDMKGEISELLVSKAEIRGIYTKLVPSKVSHVDFWRRYFYKLHQLDVDQARKEALMKRADSVKAEDSISWDDDWSGDEAAAEDSGSDWEKLPRPNQHRITPSPTPSPPPTTSSVASPSPTPAQQSSDSAGVAQVAADTSDTQESAQQQDRVTRFHEIDLQEKEQSGDSESAVGEQDVVSGVEVSSSVLPPAPASVPALVPDTSSTPEQKQHADSFKDYLQFAHDNVEDGTETLTAQSQSLELPVALTVSAEAEPSSSIEACQSVESDSQLPAVPTVLDTPTTHTVSPTLEVVQPPPSPTADTESKTVEPSVASAPVFSETVSVVEEASGDDEETNEVKEALSVVVGEQEEEECVLKTREKGDLVVVGSGHGSPVSTSESKELSDVDDEWEQDLDIELTEEDMKEAEALARKLGDNINLEEDDWESWD